MGRTQRNRGFTLTELLVATAIFAIIMSAIVALFVASIRAVKSAYLASDAYETSRGAFSVVERDLSTVFTMRDYGDYYQFFGTPQGMTMIGVISRPPRPGETITAELKKRKTLGRITYVIFPVTVKYKTSPQMNLGDFAVTDPFNLPQLNTRPVPIQYNDDKGTADPADDTMEDELVGTVALIRYIEPGVEDLDTYPFDWNNIINDPEVGNSIKQELDASIANQYGIPQDSSDPDVLVHLNSVDREKLAAKKRELWIRMLAGQEYWIPLLQGLAPNLPNVWADGWLDPNGNALNPRDYVVAENIGVVTPVDQVHTVPLFPMQAFGPTSDPVRSVLPVSDVNASFSGYTPVTAGVLTVKTYLSGRLFETTPLTITPTMSLGDLNDALGNVPGIYSYISDGTIEVGPIANSDPSGQFSFTFGSDTSGVLQALGLYCQFFRYGRVLATSALDIRPTWNSEENLVSTDNVGNPLTPRLPAMVALRLPFAYERPYPTAPQFERNLEQLIDVPTAYTRTALFNPN